MVERCSQKASRVTKIVAGSVMDDDVNRMPLRDQQRYRIRQLQLTTLPRQDSPERIEHGAIEQIASGCGEGGRSIRLSLIHI